MAAYAPNRCSVVLAGDWNKSIFFREEWVRANVLPEAKQEPEPQLGFPSGQITFSYLDSRVRLTVGSGRVQLNPLEATREGFQAAEETALTILARLRDTPVNAFGVNFGLDVDDPQGVLAAVLHAVDADAIRARDAQIETAVLTRRLRLSTGDVVNFKVASTEKSGLHLDFNYHQDVGNADQAKEALAGRTVDLAAVSEQFLTAVYDLRI